MVIAVCKSGPNLDQIGLWCRFLTKRLTIKKITPVMPQSPEIYEIQHGPSSVAHFDPVPTLPKIALLCMLIHVYTTHMYYASALLANILAQIW